MKNFTTWLLIAFFTMFTYEVSAQRGIMDSSIFIPSFSFTYSYQSPLSGAIEETYGNNHSVGADLNFKLRNNLTLGLNFAYMFSEQIKNSSSYFTDIITDKGYVIEGSGLYAENYLYQRGYNIQLTAGYQFSFWSPNPNSGFFVQGGVGFMEYKTRIENTGNTANAVIDDYAEMYDRLRNGLMTSQTIGYRLMTKKNLTNVYGAIEFSQAWTENRRNYNADITPSPVGENMDLLISVKVGWVIPFYGRAPKDYYYY